MPAPQGTSIDPNELAAVEIAIRTSTKDFTYDGINVGSYITDAEITQVATAALVASMNYRAAPSI